MRLYKSDCCRKETLMCLGNGGYGSGKTGWYTAYYCVKCKKMYGQTNDGRHWQYRRRETQCHLKAEVGA